MTRTAVFFLLLLFLGSGAYAASHENHESHRHEAAKAPEQKIEEEPARVDLADIELVDQDGRKVKFASDVVRGRVVVIDLIYTTCPLVCPILSAILSRLQEQLGDRLGREVHLVSITVDPNTDIPPRLKEYAAKFEARPGWTFLTGERQNVTQVLKGLGGYTADLTNHPAMILVGDGGKDGWTRLYGFPSPERILEKVNEISAARRSMRSHPAK
ncbi:MAG TPA: SCO family protein [Candidatus Deferrimicrobiaceae bacterium]